MKNIESSEKRKTFINVAGIGHGPEEYARSETHDRITTALVKDYPDSITIFIPSAIAQQDQSGKLMATQMSPEWQAKELHTTIEKTLNEERESIVIAHSSGSISTMRGIEEGWVPKAVFISPTFLHPNEEIFHQNAFRRRMRPNDDGSWIMTPRSMPYEIEFLPGHLDDPMYGKLADGDNYERIYTILNKKAKIFVGSRDWNTQASLYSQFFSNVTYEIEGETHSFNVEMSSVEKIRVAIRELLENSSVES